MVVRVITYTIPHKSRRDRIKVYPLGDTHLGNRACDETKLQATITEIKDDPFAYWLGMGDYCEFINLSDPRFDPTALANWITVPALADLSEVQRDTFLDHVKPIADRCIGLLKGNHEATINKHYERNIYSEIVSGVRDQMTNPPKQLGLGYCGFIRLRLERSPSPKRKGQYWTTDIFAHHGWGGGRLAGSKALKLERAMRYFDADLILIAHWHSMQTDNATVIGLNRAGRLRPRIRRGCVTGTFLAAHQPDVTTYADIKGYPPRPTGCPVIEFNPSTQNIRIIT